MKLVKTEELEILCKELYEYPPRWDNIVTIFKDLRPNISGHFSDEKYAKYFSEIYLDVSLEELAKKHTQLNIVLKPLVWEGKKGNYNFHYDQAGRLFVYSKKDSSQYEYDKVILVNGLPIVFEIRIKSSYKISPHCKTGKRGVKNSLRPYVYEERLSPICKLFSSEDVGYVMVISKDMYYSHITYSPEDSIFKQFIKNNGIIRPFYTSSKNFREEVKQMVVEYGLNLKENKT